MQLAPDQYVDVKVVIISWNNFIPLIPLLHSKIQYAAIPWTLVIVKKYLQNQNQAFNVIS